MLPVLSVWADSTAVTNPDLLENIARRSANAAVGVLCNAHVTGVRLARIAAGANFLVSHLEEAGDGEALMHGRSTEDQVALILAAADRSAPAAKMLARWADPHAALTVVAELGQHRLATHRQVAEDIVDRAGRGYEQHMTHPAYPQLLAALAPDQVEVYLVAADALTATTATELIDLMPRVDDATFGTLVADTLMAVLFPFPEVSEHWARNGGRNAAKVAAADHRLPQETLRYLFETWAGESDVVDALLANPAVPVEWKVENLTNRFNETLARALANGDTYRDFGLPRTLSSLTEAHQVFGSLTAADLRDLDEDTIDQIIGMRCDVSVFLLLEMLTTAVRRGHSHRARLELTHEVHKDLMQTIPAWVGQLLVDAAGVLDPVDPDDHDDFDPFEDDAHAAADRLYNLQVQAVEDLVQQRSLPVPVIRRYLPEDASWKEFAEAAHATGRGRTIEHAAADGVAALTTAEQYVALYARQAQVLKDSEKLDYTAKRRMREVLDEPFPTWICQVAGKAKEAPVPTGSTRLEDLIPSALGAL